MEPMPFLCCSFELNRRSQSQTRKQKKRKQKAARGVCQLRFEKASPHITCSRLLFITLERVSPCLKSIKTFGVSNLFDSLQDLSTLLSVSKASIPRSLYTFGSVQGFDDSVL